ncbi:MAG: hypothetical protein Ct9H300mP16_13020 [Pseudomonadota bacterium]|nr:MAG: hypothetical protein Ct9H300mP16_13020 [Pseudomonadota bacterium]
MTVHTVPNSFFEDTPTARRNVAFPDIDFAPIAEGFAFEAATIRSLDDLKQMAPMLKNPEGPILLDCKVNAELQGHS